MIPGCRKKIASALGRDNQWKKSTLKVLERRVFPFIETEDPDVILGAVFGEDVALTRVGGDVLISHVDLNFNTIG